MITLKMPGTFLHALFCLSLLLSAFFPLPAEAGQLRLGVLDFENASQAKDPSLGRKISQILSISLAQGGMFQIVERTSLDKVLNEQARGQSGFIDSKTAAGLGKVLGLNYLVTGKIINAEVNSTNYLVFGLAHTSVTVKTDVRFIDATSGKILLAISGTGNADMTGLTNKGEAYVADSKGGSSDQTILIGDYPARQSFVLDAVQKAVADAVKKIQDYTPVEGIVIKARESDVFIDAGKNRGVHENDEFVVFREGKAVIDPSSGEVVGVEEEDIATITIREVEDSFSKAAITSKTSAINPGDKIRKKPKQSSR